MNRNYRASLVARSLSFLTVFPLPDGINSELKRLHLSYLVRYVEEVITNVKYVALLKG